MCLDVCEYTPYCTNTLFTWTHKRVEPGTMNRMNHSVCNIYIQSG